ncbi:hypothetical protein Tco_1200126, partial [Tanacetum coccineum]
HTNDDDTNDEDEEPFEDEDDDKEEEEHLAPADSSAIPIVDHVPSAGDTEAFETDESAPTPRSPQTKVPFAQTRLRRARKTVRLEPPMSASMDYGITDTWDEIVEAMLEVEPTTLEGVNQRVTELATTVRQENEESQVQFEDEQDDRAYLRARVNTLFRDRPYHRHTAMILDREAMYARIAWTSFEDRSASIEAHVRTLEAQVATLIAQTSSLQTQLTTALRRIETLEARDPEPQDEPAEAGISC